MRSLLLLWLFVLCGCIATINQVPEPKLTGPELAKQLIDETVALVLVAPSKDPAKYKDKVWVFCSGVYISNDVILTAAHCMNGYAHMTNGKKESEEEEKKELAIPDHMRVPFIVASEVNAPGMYPKRAPHASEVIYDNARQDLALLRVISETTLPAHGFVRLAKESPPVGAKVEAMGHIERQYFSYREGVVSSYRDTMKFGGEKDIDGPFLQASILVYMGDSGGGLFDDEGHLIGIASFVNGATSGLVYYIALPTIRGVVQAHSIK